jgi:hypothetical protein
MWKAHVHEGVTVHHKFESPIEGPVLVSESCTVRVLAGSLSFAFRHYVYQ